jgi:citrate synthase
LARAAAESQSREPEVELEQGRRLIQGLAALLVPPAARGRASHIAELVARGARAPRSRAVAALDLALVLLADHELNASSFAARVAASTDAPLLACMLAALCTLSGPRHGGACDRVEALLDEAATLTRPRDVVERRVRRGEAVPGFGHALYPAGDPRAPVLLEQARALARQSPGRGQRLAACFAVADVMQRQGLPPTVDFALVTLTRALGLSPGAAALLFALGRSAGWVAHVLEQRRSTAVLRPRARYVDG